jgi:hypothetical protein
MLTAWTTFGATTMNMTTDRQITLTITLPASQWRGLLNLWADPSRPDPLLDRDELFVGEYNRDIAIPFERTGRAIRKAFKKALTKQQS